MKRLRGGNPRHGHSAFARLRCVEMFAIVVTLQPERQTAALSALRCQGTLGRKEIRLIIRDVGLCWLFLVSYTA